MKEGHRPPRWRITKGELKGLPVLNPGDRKGFPERGIRTVETERVLIANIYITSVLITGNIIFIDSIYRPGNGGTAGVTVYTSSHS